MAKDYMPSPDQYLRNLDNGGAKPPANWRRRAKRTLVAILMALGIGLAVLAAVVWYSLSRLSINPLDFGPLAATGGRTNILIMGIGDPGHAGEKLSDTMMVLSLDKATKQAAFLSLPRDLRVKVPGYGYYKVNNANALGGPELAEQTVANTLDIPIHYYIKTDFTGLKQAVDAVGGIDITVKDELRDPEYPCADNEGLACGIDIKPGDYHMDGTMALQYARCRKGTCGNDFGRAARQQEVLQKLKDKITQPGFYFNPAADSALLGAVSQNSQTNMSINDLVKVAWFMKNVTGTKNFVLSTSPGGLLMGDPYGSSDLLPVGGDYSAIQDKAHNIFSD